MDRPALLLVAMAKDASVDGVGADEVAVKVATPHLVVMLRPTAEREAREARARRATQKHWTLLRLAIRYASHRQDPSARRDEPHVTRSATRAANRSAPRSEARFERKPRRTGARRTAEAASALVATRTRVVWVSFLVATAAVSGLLMLGQPRPSGPALASIASDAPEAALQPTAATVELGRWTSIVIHHSGQPGGTPESIEREHRGYGYASLGYHFLIGNGAGLGDGAIHAGPRWHRQQPGAHVAARPEGMGPDADELNLSSIGICLVGNGNRREFSARQIRELIALVRRLQWELGIPGSAVHLHSDLAEVDSPGALFPVAAFTEAILD